MIWIGRLYISDLFQYDSFVDCEGKWINMDWFCSKVSPSFCHTILDSEKAPSCIGFFDQDILFRTAIKTREVICGYSTQEQVNANPNSKNELLMDWDNLHSVVQRNFKARNKTPYRVLWLLVTVLIQNKIMRRRYLFSLQHEKEAPQWSCGSCCM